MAFKYKIQLYEITLDNGRQVYMSAKSPEEAATLWKEYPKKGMNERGEIVNVQEAVPGDIGEIFDPTLEDFPEGVVARRASIQKRANSNAQVLFGVPETDTKDYLSELVAHLNQIHAQMKNQNPQGYLDQFEQQFDSIMTEWAQNNNFELDISGDTYKFVAKGYSPALQPKTAAIKYLGRGNFMDEEPVEGTDNVFPYVEFPSLERADYGLSLRDMKTQGEIDSIEVGDTTFDPSAIAPLSDFKEALEALEDDIGYLLEEFPMVEVTNENQWKQVQKIMSAKQPDTNPPVWDGPGVYDFRELTKSYDSVEEYELESMEYWANDVMDGMFQSDDWKNDLKKLLDRNQIKTESSEFKHRRQNRMEPIKLIQMAMEALEKNRVQANTGYVDVPAQLRASYLLGQATEKLWKKSVAEIKKKLGKEMHKEVDRLGRWGTAKPSEANIKDVIRKILIKNGIPDYPEIVSALYANPFGKSGYQTRGSNPDGVGDMGTPEPR